MKDGYDLVKIFKALSDETRQEIFSLLGKGEMNVTDICSEFRISQPTISHHLQILRNCELVGCRKQGKNAYYYVRRDFAINVFGHIHRKFRIKISFKK